jgi:hypothetical protein
VVELPEYDLTVFGEVPVASSPATAKIVMPERVTHFRQFDLLPVGQDIYGKNGELETHVGLRNYCSGFAEILSESILIPKGL